MSTTHTGLSPIAKLAARCKDAKSFPKKQAHESKSILGEALRTLTSDEINRSIELINQTIDAQDPRFDQLPKPGEYKIGNIVLLEPYKKLVLEVWLEHKERKIERIIEAQVYDNINNLLYEFVIHLKSNRVIRVTPVPGAQPPVLFADEYLQGPVFNQAAASHYVSECELGPDDGSLSYKLALALRKRGLSKTNVLNNVIFDPWSAGYYGTELDKTGKRMGRWPVYYSKGPSDNQYSRPIENLYIITDRNTLELLDVVDGYVVPIPNVDGNYATAEDNGVPFRVNKVLEYNRPEGNNVKVNEDGLVEWQGWSFYVRFDPVRGIVLNTVSYRDPYTCKDRPIIYEAGLSDMVVPYGSPDLIAFWKNAFDIGEYGVGLLANTLVEGEDVPAGSQPQFLDGAVSFLFEGQSFALDMPRVIAIYEEDAGILWKHTIFGTDFKQVRRATNLVVMIVPTVGNYEYVIRHVFHQDGTKEFEVQATGIAQPQAAGNGYTPSNAGELQGPVKGTYHQHLFCFRIDPCVDGPKNRVTEIDAVPSPIGPDNPYNNAFEKKITLLESEKQARRLTDANKSRYWMVEPEHKEEHDDHRKEHKNRCKKCKHREEHKKHHEEDEDHKHKGYMLYNSSSQTQTILAREDSWINRRARFTNYNLWVTRYHRGQLSASGKYINQNPGPDGLPVYIKDNEPIVDKDLVLWAMLGQTHWVTQEDFPVVNTTMTTRKLYFSPMNMFKKNPAINLPPPTPIE